MYINIYTIYIHLNIYVYIYIYIQFIYSSSSFLIFYIPTDLLPLVRPDAPFLLMRENGNQREGPIYIYIYIYKDIHKYTYLCIHETQIILY